MIGKDTIKAPAIAGIVAFKIDFFLFAGRWKTISFVLELRAT